MHALAQSLIGFTPDVVRVRIVEILSDRIHANVVTADLSSVAVPLTLKLETLVPIPFEGTIVVPTSSLTGATTWDVDDATTETELPCADCGDGVRFADAFSVLGEDGEETGEIVDLLCANLRAADPK